MKIILCLLCIIGVVYVFIFFKRRKEYINYNKIINELDKEMIKNKKKIEDNKKVIRDLDKRTNKLKSRI